MVSLAARRRGWWSIYTNARTRGMSRGASSTRRSHTRARRGDFAAACELIAQHWLPLFNQGQLGTLTRWIDALPHVAVLADARVCLARGWVALFLGRYADVEAWLRCANEAASVPTRDGLGSVEANAALLQASLATLSGDVATARDAAQRALAEYEDRSAPGRAIAKLNLGQAQYYAHAATDASSAFSEVLGSLSGNEWAAAIVTALGYVAAIHFDAGELELAEQCAAQAERTIDACRVHEAPFTSPALLARGRLLELTGDLAAAQSALERAVTVARRGDWRLALADALLTFAGFTRRRGDHGAARSLARQAREVLARCPDPGVLRERLTRTERTLQLAQPQRGATAAPGYVELSDRELVILRLLASELSQREIGSELFVSFNTVKSHTRSVFRKLGVATPRRRGHARARARSALAAPPIHPG